MVIVPMFESIGKSMLEIFGKEIFTFHPTVTRENIGAWLNCTDNHYAQQVKESHMEKFGNLDNINEAGYKAYIQRASPEGLIQDIDSDVYHPLWQFSPQFLCRYQKQLRPNLHI